MHRQNIIFGISFMIAGMFCLSVNDVVVKGLSRNFPVWEIIFFSIFIDGTEIIITRKEFEAAISTLVSSSMLTFDNAIENAEVEPVTLPADLDAVKAAIGM